MKKNKLYYLIMLFCIPAALLAQNKKHQTFQEIKSERDAYFAKQLKERGPAYLKHEGSEYNQYRNWLNIWEPRIGPNNGTVEGYISVMTKSINDNARAKNGSINTVTGITDPWTELGPIQTPTVGIATNGGGQKGIGPIQYITFYRLNPSRMLASSLSGGLFYSGNRGNSWKNAGSDKWTLSGCISAAFSPADSNTWYGCSHIGGGWNRHAPESNFAIGPGGVWRTTNKGVDYTLIGSASTFTVLAEQTTIHKILIDPSNAAVGYVATTGGLYKSSNITTATPTWSLIKTGNIEDIEFKVGNSSIIFITLQTAYFVDPNGYHQTNNWDMQVSTNSGGTWTSLSDPSGGFIANQSVYIPPSPGVQMRTEPGNLEITVTEANSNLIYVQDVQYSGPTEKIHTYNYSTGVWTLRTTLNGLTHGLGRGFGVSNANEAIVYVGDYTTFGKSINYGANTTVLSPSSATTPYHSDVEGVFAPPLQNCTTATCSTDVFIAHHGGVSYSSNACATIVAKSSGLGIAEVTGNIAQSRFTGKKMVVGLYHDGSVMSSPVTGSDPWQTVNDGDGDGSVIDQSNDNHVWTSVNTFGGPGFEYSNTGGAADTYNESTVMSNAYTRSVIQNNLLPNYFYFKSYSSGLEQVSRSNDTGVDNIEQLTNYTSPTYTATGINHMAVSTSNPNYIYISVIFNKDGVNHLMRNTNVNAAAAAVQTSWQNLSFALPGSPWYGGGLAKFVVDCYNPNIVYLTFWGGFVWKADYTNAGSPVFTNMTGNLPFDPSTNHIVMERGSNGGLYIASDRAVYYTNNDYQNSGTDSWVEIGVLPHVSKSTMEINYYANKLRVGLGGRGIWEHDLVCPVQDVWTLNNVGIAPAFFEANYITSANSLTTSNDATIFRATHSITLSPNFIAASEPGGSFLAFIHGCSSPGTSFGIKNGDEQGIVFEEEDEEEQENIEESFVQAIPNPSNGLLTLTFSDNDVQNVFIYDMRGKVIFKDENVKGNRLPVNITNQPAGVYLIRVICNDKIISRKVIKQ